MTYSKVAVTHAAISLSGGYKQLEGPIEDDEEVADLK